MPSISWSFDGIDLNTKAWGISEIPEGLGLPGFRGDNLKLPFLHGRRYIKKRYEQRSLIFVMWVRGLDKTTGKVTQGKTAQELLQENIDYLSACFAKKTGILSASLPTQQVRNATAQVAKPVSFIKKIQGYAVFMVEFTLFDPFFYGQTIYSEQKSVTSSALNWNHNNPGNAPSVDMVITLVGPMESPKLENQTNGLWLSFLGSIGSGESLVIATKDFSCTKGSDNYIGALKHAGDAYWFILEPGANSLYLTGDSVQGGSITIEYFPAFF